MSNFATLELIGFALLSGGTPADRSAVLTMGDVVAAINSKDQKRLNQITVLDGDVVIRGTNAFAPSESMSRSNFAKMILGCVAESSADELFLSCPNQPTKPGACTHYAYSVSANLSAKVEFIKAYKSMYVPRGCEAPIQATSPTERG